MMLSLRARLVVGLVALVLAGLLVADVAAYIRLGGLLQDRVDSQLLAMRHQANEPPVGFTRGPYPGGPQRGGPPGGFATYVAHVDSDGTVHEEASITNPPTIPRPLSSVPANTPMTQPGSGGSDWRLLVSPDDQGGYLVVAVSLSEVDNTLATLVQQDAIIGAAVLLAMVVLTLLIVRLGLRPLERMGQTAEAIAGGDLSRRVSPATPRTEIGRLGVALNGMLSQIESAFAERTQSEQRLRRFIADASH